MLARIDVASAPEQRGYAASPSAWNGASTSTPTSGGKFTGGRSRTYTFVGANDTETIGSGAWWITWTDGAGNTGTLYVGSGYTAGTALAVHDGLTIAFSAGNVAGNDFFTVATVAWRKLRRDHQSIQAVEPTYATPQGTTRRSRDEILDMDDGTTSVISRAILRSMALLLDWMPSATYDALVYLESQRAMFCLAEDYGPRTILLWRGAGTTPMIGPDGVFARASVASLIDARTGLSRHVASGLPRIVSGPTGRALQMSSGSTVNVLPRSHPKSGTLGWSVGGGASITWDTSTPTMLDPDDTTWPATMRAGCARVYLVGGDAVQSDDATIALAADTAFTGQVWLRGRGTVTLHLRSGAGSPTNSRGFVTFALTPTWTRYVVKGVALAADTRLDLSIVSSGACTLYIGAAQAEAGYIASSLVVTDGATATRAADTLTFAQGVPFDSGTLSIRFYWPGIDSGITNNTLALVQATGIGAGERFAIWYNEQQDALLFYTLGGASPSPLTASSIALSTGFHEVTVTWEMGAAAGQIKRTMYLDGAQVAQDTNSTAWAGFGTGLEVGVYLSGASNTQLQDFRIDTLRLDAGAWTATDASNHYRRMADDDWLHLREYLGRHFLLTTLTIAQIDEYNWDKMTAIASLVEASRHGPSLVVES